MGFRINKKKALDLFDRLTIILLLLMQVRSFREIVIPKALGGGGLRGVALFLNLAPYAFTVPYLLSRPGRFVWLVLKDKLLILLVLLVLASVMWSIVPEETLTRSLVFLAGTYLGVYLAVRYEVREQMQIIASALVVFALVSTVVALKLPNVGKDIVAGQLVWVGVFGQKNALGRIMCIGSILMWAMARPPYKRWWAGARFILFFVLILLARSATSAVTLALILGITPFFQTLKWRDVKAIPIIMISGILIASLIAVFLITNPEFFFQALGRDPKENSFFGRLNLWQDVSRDVMRRPWLGYGFQAFWHEKNPRLAPLQIGRSWASSAHNGYLDVCIQFGLLGLCMLLAHLIVNMRRSIAFLRSNGTIEGIWSFSYLVFIWVSSLGYSTLLDKWTIFWTFYVTVSLSMRLGLYRADKQRSLLGQEAIV